MLKKLNKRHEKFLRNILKGMTQRDAYKKTFNAKYSNKAIDEKACVMFNDPLVKQKYRELQEELDKETIVSVKSIIDELKMIAFANGTDYAQIVTKKVKDKDTGKVLNEYQDVEFIETNKVDDERKRAISCIKSTKNGISVETYDKVKALELLGKYKGIWTDKDVNVNANVSLSEEDRRLLSNVMSRLK